MVKVKILLKEQLDKCGLTQKELSEATEVRAATIHDLYHNKSKQIPIKVLEKIADELNIRDMNKLLVIVDTEDNTN
ncbi:helix-turn-helix domain-containing protein [Priestia taiwanensis]|uniref:HTH cro/C1-type domain-containing protein n=1 Tax=Priestia taiwanensis TaxID=1347902 RepID=A0A917AXL0_9BACI|nr:helix-turn-helix transcriptional regulator [Priestia taiwanensis]MBM7364576.1 DNA-binding Xre family transcriptional regulator [Priestia taiwanensis]GGE80415.1 hypothetical protein GCM10007140_32420 [Priestia taiwanensis]